MEENTSKDSDGIKSTAVVKYSVPKPSQYMQLKCNTDLNCPPANWLSSSVESYGLQHVLYHPKGFSRMAQSFLECIGSVDVVSDAENIKNLLKIPYHKGLISMMVHRIDNTLLLDEFDIYKHILLKAKTEWEWFKKFFQENVDSNVTEYERHTFIKNKTRKALRQKSLVSKFLYHSLVQNENDLSNAEDYSRDSSLPATGPLLPNPAPSAEVPDPTTYDHAYNRNVVWTFEDIEMLLGTDMPIFGGGTHPCISLRLNDMSKPISVLTGIDYWLDNLMSNVPEVVMCYHLNGIVQKYELVKTEELPCLDNSKFSPKLIRDVAQSILSFLKSNTTKAGHTYWLFKGKDEDVVKLYDLTSLCSEDDVKNGQNPFTIPVAMLLYRVARNMRHSDDRRRPGTIRLLLKNCVKLLHEEKYPEIVTSSHFMLSDLYIPGGTNPDSPAFDENDCEDTESIYDDDDEDEKTSDCSTKFLYLDSEHYNEKYRKQNKRPPPITGTVDERCIQAVYHVTEGLNCLQYFPKDTEKERRRQEEENIPMAKPFEPIPMPYEKLNKSEQNERETSTKSKKKSKKNKSKTKKIPGNEGEDSTSRDKNNALLPKEKAEALPTWQEQVLPNISWKDHLKILLYEKAILVYAILAEHHYVVKNYGNSLRYLGILARCLNIMKTFTKTVRAPLEENCLLGRVGDCCIMIVNNWCNVDVTRNQFHTHLDEDLKMIEQLEKDEQLYKINISQYTMKCVLLYDVRTIEQMLLKGVECYEKALKYGESDSILRRLGNNYNEVGSFYLHRAKNSTNSETVKDSCIKSESYLKKGLELFERVNDEVNIALLCTNMGHWHRFMAHVSSPETRKHLTHKERLHYNEACAFYLRALNMLKDRSLNPSVWDTVHWDICTTYYTMGTIAHENPVDGDLLEASKEIIEIYQKALQYCDMNEEHSTFPLYELRAIRAALILYKLAGLYHHIVYTGIYGTETNKKLMIRLAETNYDKSSELSFAFNDGLNFFVCKLQKHALYELMAETATNTSWKFKHFQRCLKIFNEIQPMVQKVMDRQCDIPEEDTVAFDIKASEGLISQHYHTLILFIKTRLQTVLKTLVKLCMGKPSPVKDSQKLLDIYKSCYSLTFPLEQCREFYTFVKKLNEVLLCIGEKIKDVAID